MAFRFDRGSLRSPKRLDDGRLIGEGVLTKTGVFTYRNPDGSERREYRPPDEVFRADSMETFALVPITDDHPSEMITAATARQLSVGTVGESIRQDGEYLIAPLAVNDAEAVAKLDAGKTALSCGYVCDIEETSGTSPDGERYDSIQRNIRGNHVAIVDIARAGPEARIRMDAAYQVDNKEANTMEELKEALKKCATLEAEKASETARADKAEAELKAAQERADKAEAERDSAKEAAESADKARTDAAEGFAQAVADRVKLEASATKVCGKDFDCSGKSDREIKCAVIKQVQNFDCGEDKSDTYVEARYDAALEIHESKPYEGLAPVSREDDGDSSEDAARARMIKRNYEIGRKPLNSQE